MFFTSFLSIYICFHQHIGGPSKLLLKRVVVVVVVRTTLCFYIFLEWTEVLQVHRKLEGWQVPETEVKGNTLAYHNAKRTFHVHADFFSKVPTNFRKIIFSKTFLKIYFTFVPTCLWFLSRSVKGTKSLSSVEVECAFALTKAIFVNIFDFFFSSASSPLSRTESSEEWVMAF